MLYYEKTFNKCQIHWNFDRKVIPLRANSTNFYLTCTHECDRFQVNESTLKIFRVPDKEKMSMGKN